MDDVAKMTPETTRNSANVRIYCDDHETRWSERKDPASGRTLGGWEDKDNWILYPTLIRPGCLFTRGGTKVSYGETFREYIEGEPPENQADVRATISVSYPLGMPYLHVQSLIIEEICDKAFFKEPGVMNKGKPIAVVKAEADLSLPKYGIDTFGKHLSRLLLHEVSLYVISKLLAKILALK